MRNQNNLIGSIKILLLALVLAGGVSYISAWTGATTAAPTGNISAPINVGSITQTKLGNLVVNGLSVNAATILSGTLQIASGVPAQGKVLLANDASGTVSWVATSSLGVSTGVTASTVQSTGWVIWTEVISPSGSLTACGGSGSSSGTGKCTSQVAGPYYVASVSCTDGNALTDTIVSTNDVYYAGQGSAEAVTHKGYCIAMQ